MKYENLQGVCLSGRYTLGRILGYGGMGSVYLARDAVKGQEVALKVLHEKHRDQDWIVARFAREVDVLRTLSHPNVVDLYDAGKDGRKLYYTMEYIKGHNLREWMFKHQPLDFGSAVHILYLTARGLQYIHKRYIHRDIAPENIMLRKDGSVKIIDFGLARKNQCNEGLTIIGTGLGRTDYNAPEQERNAAVADFRADIYPMGVLLYEMLTGTLPPRDTPPSVLAKDLPRGCEAFLTHTLAADAFDRYPDAKTAGKALLDIYHGSATGRRAATRLATGSAAPRGSWTAIRRFFRKLAFWRR